MANWYMEKNGISCRIEGPVAYYTVNRPESKNGMNWEAKAAQAEAYEHIAADPEVRVMVVTAVGEYFITGGRVDASVPGEKELYAKNVHLAEEARRRITVPIIAAINGHCLKGGIGLAAQADIAFAKETATFSFPEILMGSAPMMVMARCIGHIPKKMALEAYYSGQSYTAQRMYEIGFLNDVTDEEHFEETLNKYIHMIIDQPRELVQIIHNNYKAMEQMSSVEDRIAFAEKQLAGKVLPQMTTSQTDYKI